MKKMTFILMFFCFAILSSCSSGDLSRKKASSQIYDSYLSELKGKSGFDDIQIGNRENGLWGKQFSYRYTKNGDDMKQPDDEQLIKLKEAGLLQFESKGQTTPGGGMFNFYDILFKVSVTKDGAKFLTNEYSNGTEHYITVKTFELDEIEIKSISAPSDMNGYRVCRVRYLRKYSLTPFGKCLYGKDYSIREGNALFVLNDDGWELERN